MKSKTRCERFPAYVRRVPANETAQFLTRACNSEAASPTWSFGFHEFMKSETRCYYIFSLNAERFLGWDGATSCACVEYAEIGEDSVFLIS